MCKYTCNVVLFMVICANTPLEKHYHPNKELEHGRA